MSNDTSPTVAERNLEHALALAGQGFKIIPIPLGEKYPKGIGEWQKKATSDIWTVQRWWGSRELGIGWAMGLQPNGKRLVCVDVDDWDAWEGWRQDLTFATVTSKTGGGGAHYVFELDDDQPELSNGKLVEGVDIRGEGGFIVVPPTIHPNGNQYQWECYPTGDNFERCPDQVVEALTYEPPPRPAPVALTSTRPSSDDQSPADWVRENLTIADLLEADGWNVESQRGGDTYYTRPDKNPRDGHSAILHGDGPFIVFSTMAPGAYWRVGRENRDGSKSLSPFDVYAAAKHQGDLRAASSTIRKDWMRTSEPRHGGMSIDSLVQSQEEQSPKVAPSSMNVAPEFWEQRPWLDHIRQAAWSRLMSPDAVLGAVISRFATAIPPCYRIPAIVGAAGTFDHLSVLVGESSGGKSAAMAIARELFEGPQYKGIVWDFPAPTGEGLVDAFFEFITEEQDGKKVQVNKKTKTAVHFSIDEAMALVQAGGRQSATIGSVLCTAWAGGNPGQGNASKDRQRVGMNPFTFRMAGLMGIQTSLGQHILSEEWVRQGLAGRLVFFAAEDPSIPPPSEGAVPWPGPLDIAIPTTVPLDMTYPPEVWAEVRDRHYRKMTKQETVAGIDGHRDLVRLKLSGILALMDGRDSVSISDWDLSTVLLASSTVIRNHMESLGFEQKKEQNMRAAEAAGHFEVTKDDTIERQKIAKLREAIIRKVAHSGAEGIPQGELRRTVTAGSTRHRFEPALEAAVADGAIRLDGARWFWV